MGVATQMMDERDAALDRLERLRHALQVIADRPGDIPLSARLAMSVAKAALSEDEPNH